MTVSRYAQWRSLLARHSDVKTTMMYIHVFNRVPAGVESIHGGGVMLIYIICRDKPLDRE